VLLRLTQEIDVHDRRAAVALLVVGVGQADTCQVQPGYD
jgi:hypothetical protein